MLIFSYTIKDTGEKIVHWPEGILSGSGKQATTYHGVEIEWSGYNGDGTGSGHEYIKITGTLNRTLTMKAFGYQAGYATVNYSWGTFPIAAEGFLSFPLAGYTAYNAPISSVFDHSMDMSYCPDNKVVAYTDEQGIDKDLNELPAVPSSTTNCPGLLLYSFKKANGSQFNINGNYVGTQATGSSTLNYDGHPGYDYRVPIGTNVLAAADGEVIVADSIDNDASGKYVKIGHPEGYETLYMHLNELFVGTTDKVKRGQLIAKSGNTGGVSPHLHFEVRKNGIPVDPYGWKGALGQDPLQVDGQDNVCLWKVCQ